MTAFVIAMLLGIVGLIMAVRKSDVYDWPMRGVGLTIMGIGFLFFLGSVITIVPSGHVGVITVFGDVQDDVLHEGLAFIAPWANCNKMSIRQQTVLRDMNASSAGGVTFDLKVSVVYRLNPEFAASIYQNIGPDYYEILISPLINNTFKNQLVEYSAEALYTDMREPVSMAIEAALAEKLAPLGIILERSPIENMDLPVPLRDAIVERDAAEQRALQMVYTIQEEQLEKERMVIEAEGVAEYQRIVNQSITQEFLQWKALEVYNNLAGSDNTTFVLAIGENGMPMILNPQ